MWIVCCCLRRSRRLFPNRFRFTGQGVGHEVDDPGGEITMVEHAGVLAPRDKPRLEVPGRGAAVENPEIRGRHETVGLAVDQQEGARDLVDIPHRRHVGHAGPEPALDEPSRDRQEWETRQMQLRHDAPGELGRIGEGGTADQGPDAVVADCGDDGSGGADRVAEDADPAGIELAPCHQVGDGGLYIFGKLQDGDGAVTVALAVASGVEQQNRDASLVEEGRQVQQLRGIPGPSVNQNDGGSGAGRDEPAVQKTPLPRRRRGCRGVRGGGGCQPSSRRTFSDGRCRGRRRCSRRSPRS